MPIPNDALTTAERISLLSKSPIFSAYPVDFIAELARESTERRVAEKTVMWHSGEESQKFFIIISGAAKGSNDTQSFFFGPGDAIGLLDSLAKVPRWYMVESQSPLIVLELTVLHLLDVFEDNSALAMKLVAYLAQGVIEVRKSFAEVVYSPSPGWR